MEFSLINITHVISGEERTGFGGPKWDCLGVKELVLGLCFASCEAVTQLLCPAVGVS